jgi:hypothetical protein
LEVQIMLLGEVAEVAEGLLQQEQVHLLQAEDQEEQVQQI